MKFIFKKTYVDISLKVFERAYLLAIIDIEKIPKTLEELLKISKLILLEKSTSKNTFPNSLVLEKYYCSSPKFIIPFARTFFYWLVLLQKKNRFVMLLRTLTRSKEQTAIWMKPSNFFWVKNTTTKNAIPIFFCLLGLFKNVKILSIWLWLHIDTVSRVFRFSFFGYSFAVTGHFFVQWSMGRMGWDATFIRYAGDCNWNCFNFHLMVWLQAGRRVGWWFLGLVPFVIYCVACQSMTYWNIVRLLFQYFDS